MSRRQHAACDGVTAARDIVTGSRDGVTAARHGLTADRDSRIVTLHWHSGPACNYTTVLSSYLTLSQPRLLTCSIQQPSTTAPPPRTAHTHPHVPARTRQRTPVTTHTTSNQAHFIYTFELITFVLTQNKADLCG